MGKKQKSKKVKSELKPRLDWYDLLKREASLPMDRLNERDIHHKTLWVAIVECAIMPSNSLDLIQSQVLSCKRLRSSIDDTIEQTDCSALGLAIKNAQLESILGLLHIGANLDQAFTDGHWLHALLRYLSDAEEVLAILELSSEKGFSFSPEIQFYRDETGFGLHDYALVKFKSDALVTWLLEHKICPQGNIQDLPVMMWLIQHDKRHLVDAYLAYISSQVLYAYTDAGTNILSHACQSGDLSLVESLLFRADGAIYAVNHQGENALHVLARVRPFTDKHHDIFRLLMAIDMDIKAVNCDGDSVLMIALRHDQNEILPMIVMISDIYQRNSLGEHCLSIALCQANFVMAKVIMGLNRLNVDKPYDIEHQMAPLSQVYIDRCHSFYGQSLNYNLNQPFLPLSILVLGYRIFTEQLMPLLAELLNRRDPYVRCEDNPYRVAMAVNEVGLIRFMLSHNVPGHEGQKINSFVANASPSSLKVKQSRDLYLDIVDQVKDCFRQSLFTQALEKSRTIPLDYYPIHWASLPDFRDHYLLMCLEMPYLSFAFESLYPLLRTYQLSGYYVLDEIILDSDGRSEGQSFSQALRVLMSQCERHKIHDRCSSQQMSKLKMLGFSLSGDEPKVIKLPLNFARGLAQLIPPISLVSGQSEDYRRAEQFWRSFLLDHCKDDTEDEQGYDAMSLMELFLKRLEHTVIQHNIRRHLTHPDFVFNVLVLVNQSPQARARLSAAQLLFDQIKQNRQIASEHRHGLVKQVLTAVLPVKTRSFDFHEHQSQDSIIHVLESRVLTDVETIGLAELYLESLRTHSDAEETQPSQLFFDYFIRVILLPSGYMDEVACLIKWMVDCPERSNWLSRGCNRAQLLDCLYRRRVESDCEEAILSVLDMVLPHYACDSIETLLTTMKESQSAQTNRSVDILIFLSDPKVYQLLETHVPSLAQNLRVYHDFSMQYYCRSAKIHYDQSLDSFQRDQVLQHNIKMGILQSKLESEQSRYFTLQSESALVKTDSSNLQKQCDQQRKIINELNASRASEQVNLNALQQELERVRQHAEKDRCEAFDLRGELDTKQEALQVLQAKYEDEQKKHQCEIDQAQKKIQLLEQKIDNLASHRAQYHHQTQEQLTVVQQDNDVLKARLSELSQSLTEVNNDKTVLAHQRDDIKDQLTQSLEASSCLSEDLDKKEAIIHTLQEKVDELQDQAMRFKKQVADQSEKYELKFGPDRSMPVISAVAVPLNATDVTPVHQPSNYLVQSTMFSAQNIAASHPQLLVMSEMLPISFGDLFSFINQLTGVLCALKTERKNISIRLGGSLALFLARRHDASLDRWYQLACSGYEDVDLDVSSSFSRMDIEDAIKRAWPDIQFSRCERSDKRLLVQHVSLPFKFDLHLIGSRKPYPDALFWNWDANRSDWVFDLSRLLPSQYEFLYAQCFIHPHNNAHLQINYSFFWALVQLIKHKFYDQSTSVCAERLRLQVHAMSNRTTLSNNVLAVLRQFEKTPFWVCALKTVIGHIISFNDRGDVLTPLSYVLPQGGHRCLNLAREPIVDIENLRNRIVEVYRAEDDLSRLQHDDGPLAWCIDLEKYPSVP